MPPDPRRAIAAARAPAAPPPAAAPPTAGPAAPAVAAVAAAPMPTEAAAPKNAATSLPVSVGLPPSTEETNLEQCQHKNAKNSAPTAITQLFKILSIGPVLLA